MDITQLALYGGKPIRKRTIPYTKHNLHEHDIKAVSDFLHTQDDISGRSWVVRKFEEALSEYTGFKHVITTNSATSALSCAYQVSAFARGTDSRVGVAALTFVATVNTMIDLGFEPILVDVDYHTMVANTEISVSYSGYPVIGGGAVVDDAHTLIYGQARYGAKISVTSFHPAKHITTGEGGAIMTSDDDMGEELAGMVDHGRGRGSKFGFGYNFRMPGMGAALGLSQLKRHQVNLSMRRTIAQMYQHDLSGYPGLVLPRMHEDHAWHLYVVRLPQYINRDIFVQAMRDEGIGVQVHYPRLADYEHLKLEVRTTDNWQYPPVANTPNADSVSLHGLSLPMYPTLGDDEYDDVIRAFDKVYGVLANG